MSHLAVMAMGRDRPGIVAAVSEVLLRHGLNIEDSQMTILGGHFATMLVVAGPERVDERTLAADLREAGERVELEWIDVKEVSDVARGRPEASHLVTVYGVDHPGIVHGVASALGDRGVNITDLETRLLPGAEGEAAGVEAQPVYVMMLEVSLPSGMRVDALEQALAATGAEQGVEITIRPLERDAL